MIFVKQSKFIPKIKYNLRNSVSIVLEVVKFSKSRNIQKQLHSTIFPQKKTNNFKNK